MSQRSVEHSTFVIERVLSAPTERVFAAWADADKKRRWFACHDEWQNVEHTLDFRSEGSEVNVVLTPAGVRHTFHARYFEIVPNERIVYAYQMYVGEKLISVSLVTVTFRPAPAKTAKTTMTFTEQLAMLDGAGEAEERREGTAVGLERLEAELR